MGHRTRLALLSIAALALLGASRCEKKADDAELEPMLIVKGTLTGEGIECPALRDQGGILYTLAGSIGSYRTGDQVCVKGRRVQMSTCQQGITITVEWIGPARDCP